MKILWNLAGSEIAGTIGGTACGASALGGGTRTDRARSDIAAAPALPQTVPRPCQPRQGGIDARISEPGRAPTVDAGVGEPDHHERHPSGRRDVGEEVPAKCH